MCELRTSDVQSEFRKGRASRDQIANIQWIIEKVRVPEKTSASASLSILKPLDCVDHKKLQKTLKEMEVSELLTCLLRNLYAH